MKRSVCAGLLAGLLVAAGCADRKKSGEPPKEMIPLPKDGPTAAGTAGKDGKPAAPPSATAE
jgi:hypothetical protein